MRIRSIANFKALILILLAIFLAEKLAGGDLFYYIRPQQGWLIMLTICLLILLGASYKRNAISRKIDDRQEKSISPGSFMPIMIVALPLLVGILVPIHQFSAADIASKGIFIQRRGYETLASLEQSGALPATNSPVLNNSIVAESLSRQTITLIGFVHRNSLLKDGQFILARYIFPCCVSNAIAIGVVVQPTQTMEYTVDSWVQVEGILDEQALANNSMPVLNAHTILPIEPPTQPYLYP
jgi:uncharacterized repeat protein (TIGR03943 family)